jgi:hypothetical protein
MFPAGTVLSSITESLKLDTPDTSAKKNYSNNKIMGVVSGDIHGGPEEQRLVHYTHVDNRSIRIVGDRFTHIGAVEHTRIIGPDGDMTEDFLKRVKRITVYAPVKGDELAIRGRGLLSLSRLQRALFPRGH